MLSYSSSSYLTAFRTLRLLRSEGENSQNKHWIGARASLTAMFNYQMFCTIQKIKFGRHSTGIIIFIFVGDSLPNFPMNSPSIAIYSNRLAPIRSELLCRLLPGPGPTLLLFKPLFERRDDKIRQLEESNLSVLIFILMLCCWTSPAFASSDTSMNYLLHTILHEHLNLMIPE